MAEARCKRISPRRTFISWFFCGGYGYGRPFVVVICTDKFECPFGIPQRLVATSYRGHDHVVYGSPMGPLYRFLFRTGTAQCLLNGGYWRLKPGLAN